MTKQELSGCMALIKMEYPTFGANVDAKPLMELWYEHFKPFPVGLLNSAIKNYIGENEYPPKISQLKKIIYQAVKPQTMDFETIRYWLDWCIENGEYILGGRSYRDAYYQTPTEFKRLVSLADVNDYANSNDYYCQRLLDQIKTEVNDLNKQQEVKFLSSQEPMKLINHYESIKLLENYD